MHEQRLGRQWLFPCFVAIVTDSGQEITIYPFGNVEAAEVAARGMAWATGVEQTEVWVLRPGGSYTRESSSRVLTESEDGEWLHGS